MPNKAVKLFQLLRSTERERRLGTVILFVTSRCNAKCATCFYWDELNQPGDMTFAQIERVSQTMPPITDLWLSGGEPTLRRDLNDIINLFVTNNGVRRVIIPTNAIIKAHVFEAVSRALGDNPKIDLYLNVALDGYGATHDRIRGVPGNWEKTLDCIRSLYPLKEKYGARFRLNVNTVVCAENYTEVEQLSAYLWENFQLDGHYFNLIRGETKAGAAIKQVPPELLPEMYARVAALTKRYGERMFAADEATTRFVKSIAYVGGITTHYRTQLANFDRQTPWAFPCTAGETTAVIDYNGDVRACELREKFATLADYDYDFGALWNDERRGAELAAIDGGKTCWCTHVCFIHDSMRHSRRALLYELPKNYATRGKW
ncbi:MAG: Fe-coproporphyrin synthase [Pyrinomonadaceae bacterium]|jgi:MoaA/NifB/PqqE/SkfB family radical SAM enzyme|nr:Fe-coproporphyrin synthase [Pyrinomonadaceae bacterium]